MAKPAAILERESDIQAAIRDYLRWTGWFVIRHHQTLGSHKGLADLQAIRRRQVIMIEVKTRRGRQSPGQLEFQQLWEAHGGTYIVARSIEDVERAIAGLPKGRTRRGHKIVRKTVRHRGLAKQMHPDVGITGSGAR